MKSWLIGICRIHYSFYSGVVDAQKLVSRSHHVDFVGLSFRTLFVHETVDRFILWLVLQNDCHNQKECPAQNSRTNFTDSLVVSHNLARVIRLRLDSRKGNERFLGGKAADITNLSHQLRAERRANAVHFHHGIKFRKLLRKAKHFLLECSN